MDSDELLELVHHWYTRASLRAEGLAQQELSIKDLRADPATSTTKFSPEQLGWRTPQRV
jgi:hypothetical protein